MLIAVIVGIVIGLIIGAIATFALDSEIIWSLSSKNRALRRTIHEITEAKEEIDLCM